MQIYRNQWNEWTILCPKGHMVISTLAELRPEFNQIRMAPNTKVAIDLGNVDSMDSSAIGLLNETAKQLAGNGGKLSLYGARGIIAETLETVQFSKRADVFHTRADFEESTRQS